MPGGDGRELLWPAHEEGQRDEDGGEGGHYPDDIDISQQAALDLGHRVDLRAGALDGAGRILAAGAHAKRESRG